MSTSVPSDVTPKKQDDSSSTKQTPHVPPKVIQLVTGWMDENSDDHTARAEGSVALILAEGERIIVDTGSPRCWDTLKEALTQENLSEDDITAVVITHGHLDHCANMGRFTKAAIYMDDDIMEADGIYKRSRKMFDLCPGISVLKLAGHTENDLIVIVEGTDKGTVVVAGDLFESEDDPSAWMPNSKNVPLHTESREIIYKMADYILPGHGIMFKNTRKNANSKKK